MNIDTNNTCTHRKCYKCDNVKELTSENFHRSKNRLCGFEYKCKECSKARTWKFKGKRILTEEQKQRKRELSSKYNKTLKYKIIHILNAYEKFDKKRNYKFSLTKEDMECMHCNIARMNNFTHDEMFVIGNAIRDVRLLRLTNEDNTDFILGTQYVKL